MTFSHPQRRNLLRSLAIICLTCILTISKAHAYTYIDPHLYANNAQKEGQLGQVLLYEGNYLGAFNALSKAIRFAPTGSQSATHYNNLGLVYLGMKEPALAAASFQTAIRLHPVSAVYYENLSRAWLVDAEAPKRLKALSDYLEYNPQHADAWFLLGVFYKAFGDKDGTQASWEQHLLLAPRSPFEKKICRESPKTCQKLDALKKL